MYVRHLIPDLNSRIRNGAVHRLPKDKLAVQRIFQVDKVNQVIVTNPVDFIVTQAAAKGPAPNLFGVELQQFANLFGRQRQQCPALFADMRQQRVQVKRLAVIAQQAGETASFDNNHLFHLCLPVLVRLMLFESPQNLRFDIVDFASSAEIRQRPVVAAAKQRAVGHFA